MGTQMLCSFCLDTKRTKKIKKIQCFLAQNPRPPAGFSYPRTFFSIAKLHQLYFIQLLLKQIYSSNISKFLLISLLLSQTLFAQQSPNYFGEIGTTINTAGQTPFWLRSNQYGIVPLQSSPFSARVGIKADYDSTDKKVKFGYGLE